MKKTIVFLILFLIPCSLFVHAAGAADTEPREYIIKERDTLWDISDTELEDSFLWPKLWNVNPQIENPDLIYPGSKIIIPSREELMRMPTPVAKLPFLRKPVPQKRREPKHTFIAREKRLAKYIIDKRLFIHSGWISAEFRGVGKVSSYPMNREIAGKDDIAYLDINREAEAESAFFTVRNTKVVKHPVTGRVIGNHYRITGTLNVVGMDDNTPKATVSASYEDITLGESLLPFREMEPPLIPEEPRTPDISGYIIESHLNNQIAGEGDIVFLDKGTDDGLAPGDIFAVVASAEVKKTVGKIQIVSVQATTAGAVVLEAEREISIGAQWGQL